MRSRFSLSLIVVVAVTTTACDETPGPVALDVEPTYATAGSGSFRFDPITPLTGGAACLDPSIPTNAPLQLPGGYAQIIIGRQSDLVTTSDEVNFDMLTLNETGPQAGRYLYRTHEVRPWAALSRIDLGSGESELLVERFDWESFDAGGRRGAGPHASDA